jgi:transcriptional regulator with XRE-family HTH domain
MPRGRKYNPPANRQPDMTKLTRLLRERGMSQTELARRIGVNSRTVHDYTTGKAWPTLPGFRAICIELRLDYFEVCELLRVPVIPMGDVISFRAECRKNGTTATEAMRQFIYLYADLIPENERK